MSIPILPRSVRPTRLALATCVAAALTLLASCRGGHSAGDSDGDAGNTTPKPDVTAPSIPTDLQVSAVNAAQVRIDWSASTDPDAGDGAAVSGVADYQLVRRIGNDSATQIDTTTDTGFTDTDIQPQTTYHYQVRAVDAAGNVSGLSADAVVTTPAQPDTTAPSVPAGLTARATSTTTVALSWSASSDDTGVAEYRIYRGGSSTALAETAKTSYTDATVVAGSSYSYQVRAVDAAGNASALSAAASATTPAAADTRAPSTPTALTATAVSAGSVTLSWTRSTDDVAVAAYRVYRSGSGTPFAEVGATTVTDTAVKPVSTYSYQVRAVDGSGNVSPLSAAVSVTTPFLHPGILVGDDRLSLVKTKVAAGAQPWLAAFQKATASRFGSLSYTPHAVAMVACTGSTSDSCYAQLQDAQAAYTDALLYRITGTKAYGDKAVEILDAWAATMRGFEFDGTCSTCLDKNTALWAAWIAEVFPRAAELMRHSGYGWPADKAAAFGAMLQFHLNFVNYSGSSMGSFDWAGNWALSFADAMMAIGVYTDDATLFARGVDKWRASMTLSVYLASDPAGHPVVPAGFYKGSSLTDLNALKADWHGPTAYVEGMEQETCRDLGHMAMAFGAALNAAETGDLQGLDLYGEQDDRFVTSIEYNVYFYNQSQFLTSAEAAALNEDPEKTPGTWIAGTDVSGWACPANPLRGGGAINLPFDIAYSHFVGRMGMAMPQTKKLLSTSRPADSSDHMNWATLTHGIPLQ